MFSVLPIACAIFCAFTIRCGVITGDMPLSGEIYYCVRDTAIPQPGDVVLFYGANFKKSLGQVESISQNKYDESDYNITVIDQDGTKTKVKPNDIFGKIQTFQKDA